MHSPAKQASKIIILNSESKGNMKLLIDLAKKLGINVRVLTNEEQEDYALLDLMDQSRTNEFVPEDVIFKSLRGDNNI